MTRRRLRIADVLVVAAALLLPLLALEIALRASGEDTRSWTRPDPILGWSYIPGAAYTHVSSEGCPGWTSSGRINSEGLRDHEIETPKPSGTFRILAAGDSFTEAFQLDLDSTWTELLEARLNARAGARRYEVINAGRSGMGTTHEWLYFAHEGRKFEVDLVLVLFIANDFQDNSKRLALATAYGPYLVPLDGGGYALDFSFRESRDYRMRRRLTPWKRASYLVSAGVERYGAWRATRAARRAAAARGAAGTEIDARTGKGFGLSWVEDDFLWVENPSAEWSEAARITDEVLRRFRDDAAAAGARLVLVNGTSRVQVQPEEISETLAAHPDWDLDRPAARLRATSDSLGIAFHDLVPEFREVAADGIFLHGCPENGGEGHWSEAGHRLASEAIARFLDGSGLLGGE